MLSRNIFTRVLTLGAAKLISAASLAPIVTDNAPGVTYGAVFDGTQGAGITGYVSVSSNINGTGSVVNVNLMNLPDQTAGGPFLYHIHNYPVTSNGSCATTGTHLDPTAHGETPPCDPTNPASCQVGDLAGKYGPATASPDWQQVYIDLFTSTTPGDPAFVGNRSLVVHLANTTRIACTNFELMDNGPQGACSASGSGTLASYPVATASSAAVTSSNADLSQMGSAATSMAGGVASTTAAMSVTATGSAGLAGASAVSAPGSAATITAPIMPAKAANGVGMAPGAMFLAALALMI